MTYHKIITLTFYGGRFYNNTSRKSRTIKGLFITIFTLLVVPEAFGQQHMADPVTDSLIATEKGAWEAWINNDVDFFEDYLAKEALQIHPNVRFNTGGRGRTQGWNHLNEKQERELIYPCL